MLRNFLYLDVPTLDGYLSALEGGLRVDVEREDTASKDARIEGDAKIVKVLGGGVRSGTDRMRGLDTPEARFSRLLALAENDPESTGWVDVVDADTDLDGVGFGAMLCGEADFYVPSMVKSLSQAGDLSSALDLLDQLEPFADQLELDTDGLPDKAQRDGFRSIVTALNFDLVAVGEFDGSDWKVAGQAKKEHLRAEPEGPARFVGKVAKQWPRSEGRHLLALPGTTLLPRKERRDLERKRPENVEDDSFLMGPAVMLDLLAVWR